MVYVNETVCTGCGLCLDACPQNAIDLIKEIATIDVSRCSECLACVEICPNGAILSVEEPTKLVRQEKVAPVARTRSSILLRERVLPIAAAALTFVGRKVGPYVADVVMGALERRADRSTIQDDRELIKAGSQVPSRESRSGRGSRRRRRQRGAGGRSRR